MFVTKQLVWKGLSSITDFGRIPHLSISLTMPNAGFKIKCGIFKNLRANLSVLFSTFATEFFAISLSIISLISSKVSFPVNPIFKVVSSPSSER